MDSEISKQDGAQGDGAVRSMKCSANGPRTLDAKWLDPECWDGCQSLILKGQVNALREKLAIIWADSNYIRVEWLRENGHEEAAKAIENIRKHSSPNGEISDRRDNATLKAPKRD